VNSGEPAIVIDVEKRGIRKRVDRSKDHWKPWEIEQGPVRLRHELIELGTGQPVPSPTVAVDEADFLDGNMQERERVEPNVAEGAEGRSKVVDLGTECRLWHPHAAERKRTLP
jgi:hypothetical protein